MRRPAWAGGVGICIAAAATGTAAVGVGIVTLGVLIVGADTFANLMMQLGSTAESAHAMFDHSVTIVLALATVAATAAAFLVALLLGRRLARPLEAMAAAAHRIAAGDYATRVRREGPDEIADLAESFNRMAGSLEEGKRLREELIANAAHELRTPLTNLKGYLEGIRAGVIPADEPTLASLSEEVERLVRLASSLDTLAVSDAAQGSARLVPLDVAAAIRAAVDLVRPAMDGAGIQPDVVLPERLRARADPDALAQVLGNLLQNATRYTPAGGRVTISAEQRANDVLVGVVNTGVTIPAADLPHVFERFYRVEKSRDRARGGAGIGLAIVQQLVEAGGGRVGAESADGRTRFWFSLPA